MPWTSCEVRHNVFKNLNHRTFLYKVKVQPILQLNTAHRGLTGESGKRRRTEGKQIRAQGETLSVEPPLGCHDQSTEEDGRQ